MTLARYCVSCSETGKRVFRGDLKAGGVMWIIPNVVGLRYYVDPLKETANVCLDLLGVNVSCVVVSTGAPGFSLSGSLGFVKSEVDIYSEANKLCYAATICFLETGNKWSCATQKGVLICFAKHRYCATRGVT